jgi:hypothetical protein
VLAPKRPPAAAGCEVPVDAVPNPPKRPPPLVVCGCDVGAPSDEPKRPPVVAGFDVLPPKGFGVAADEVAGLNKLSEGLDVLFKLPKRDVIVADRAKWAERAQRPRTAGVGRRGAGKLDWTRPRFF